MNMINLNNISIINKFIRQLPILVGLLLISTTSYAINIIRDSEIEKAIYQVINPLIKASGLKTLKIHIVSDNSVNAFTSGGEDVFINSGLITSFPDPEVLRGVVAHEMGHILGHHVLRKIEDFEQNKNVSSAGIAIGIISALSGNPVLAVGALGAGVNTAYSSNLQSSRVYEASADQSAMQLLEKSGNSSTGLLKLLNFLHSIESSDNQLPYDNTHPLSAERISAINLFIKNSKYKSSTTPPKIRSDFVRAVFKLYAFTTPLTTNIRKSGSQEIDSYVDAIISFRKSKIDKAISLIDSLLASNPNDPYYNELKGQMLFEFGKKESYASYAKASELLPDDIMIRVGKAVVMLNIFDNPGYYPAIIEDLKSSLAKEPDNLIPLYYLSVAYGKAGDMGRSSLYNGIMLFKQGKIKEAQAMAKFAASKLPPNTPEWYKANDIILSE